MNMDAIAFSERLAQLIPGCGHEWKNGSWWLFPECFDARAIASLMLAQGARFVGITVMEIEEGKTRLDYQWDMEGHLLSYVAQVAERAVVTIADLCPAADWAERETHEYFAVEFTGRKHTRPLMTRAGDKAGIHLRKEEAK